MKFSLIIVTILFLGNSIRSQWEHVSGGLNTQVLSVVTSENILYAAGSGVYKSTNLGLNWTRSSLNNNNIRGLAANSNFVFAGTYSNNGIYRSTNYGLNWTQTSLSYYSTVDIIAFDNYVFVGTNDHGIYKSGDNGLTWAQTTFTSPSVYAFAYNGNKIFAGTNGLGVYFSTDFGAVWTQSTLNTDFIYSLDHKGNNIYAGIWPYGGVRISTNNGSAWTQTGLNYQSVHTIVVNNNNVFAGTGYPYSNGVYVSNNNGANWIQRNEGLGSLYIHSLCILGNYIFAGTDDGGVYRRPLSDLNSITSVSTEIPKTFSLSQNYPNPFNPQTKIKFDVPANVKRETSNVKLIIYDLLGREVTTLVNEELKPGTYEADWDGSNYSSGVYFYKLIVDDPSTGSGREFVETKKMVLMK